MCTGDRRCARHATSGRVGLVGVSVGATLALLVAADERLASRVSLVACIAPFTDLRKVMMLATTGIYRDDAGVQSAYPTPPSLAVGLGRSIAAMLPPTAAAAGFNCTVRALDTASDDPLAPLRTSPSDPFDRATNSVRELLANQDPARFDDLHDSLPTEIRSTIEMLSPVCVATRIRAPIEIATAPRDTYFPVAESLALRSARKARVTITPALAHANPRLDLDSLNGIAQLGGFFVRSLVAAEAAHPKVAVPA